MDNVRNVLASWGCTEDTINNFEEQDICLEVLKDLSNDDLKELVPTLGMRKLIGAKIAMLKMENKENETFDNSSLATTVSADQLDSFTTGGDNSLIIDTANTLIVKDDNSVVLDLDLNALLTEVRTFPDFDLSTLLQTSPMGNSVLKYYQTEKTLDSKRRGRLVDIIIKHLYSYIISNRLRHEEYNKIAAKIITLFPLETMGIYYVPAIKKNASLSGKPVVARGRLVDKVKNIIRTCEEAIPKRKRKLVDMNDEEGPATPKKMRLCDELLTVSIDENENCIWLRLNTDPWTEVVTRWEATYDLRRSSIHNSTTLREFIKTWSILQDPRSESLINCDFQRIFPKKEVQLFTKWKPFYDTVKLMRKSNLTDEPEESKDNKNEDVVFLKQLIKLPYLIPPKGRLVKEKRHWKWSTLEVVDSIVLLAKTPVDINEVIEKQKKFASSRGITLQPFIVIEGSLEEPNNCYIILDDVFLHLNGAQRAFDILFKIFHVVNAQYPIQSNYIYTLIQKCVYGIHLEVDNLPPHTLDIVHKMDVCLQFEG